MTTDELLDKLLAEAKQVRQPNEHLVAWFCDMIASIAPQRFLNLYPEILGVLKVGDELPLHAVLRMLDTIFARYEAWQRVGDTDSIIGEMDCREVFRRLTFQPDIAVALRDVFWHYLHADFSRGSPAGILASCLGNIHRFGSHQYLECLDSLAGHPREATVYYLFSGDYCKSLTPPERKLVYIKTLQCLQDSNATTSLAGLRRNIVEDTEVGEEFAATLDFTPVPRMQQEEEER